MSIPLIQKPEKDDINTSIIAIKRNIERINMLLGLSNSEEIDTSEFVKKSDIVDEVAIGNMQSVTSNAVAVANSYSTSETFTGRYWIDGKKIYRKSIDCGVLPNQTTKYINHNINNIDIVISLMGWAKGVSGSTVYLPLPLVSKTNKQSDIGLFMTSSAITIEAGGDRSSFTKSYVTVEYTKTTD